MAAVNKPNLTWRRHCDIGKGCRIYETRPAECVQFTCLWLTDEGFPLEFRPTRAKFVTYRHVNNGCIVVDCDAPARNVHLDRKYAPMFARMAATLEPQGAFLTVCYGKEIHAITPQGIYDFGKTRASHVIRIDFNPVLKKINKLYLEKLWLHGKPAPARSTFREKGRKRLRRRIFRSSSPPRGAEAKPGEADDQSGARCPT